LKFEGKLGNVFDKQSSTQQKNSYAKVKINKSKKRTKPSSRNKSKFPDFCKLKLQPSENLECEIFNYRPALELLKRLNEHFCNNDPYIKKKLQHMMQVHVYMLFLEIKTWREAKGGSYWLCRSKNTG
jgi:hypothetical protein